MGRVQHGVAIALRVPGLRGRGSPKGTARFAKSFACSETNQKPRPNVQRPGLSFAYGALLLPGSGQTPFPLRYSLHRSPFGVYLCGRAAR
jgi:hypothetical protein